MRLLLLIAIAALSCGCHGHYARARFPSPLFVVGANSGFPKIASVVIPQANGGVFAVIEPEHRPTLFMGNNVSVHWNGWLISPWLPEEEPGRTPSDDAIKIIEALDAAQKGKP